MSTQGYRKQLFSVYIPKCVNFIKNRIPRKSIRFTNAYKSYITGLKYHKYVEKPSNNRIYLCMPEPNNKFDSNAIAVFANNERIGFVPKDLCSKVNLIFQKQIEDTIMLCYCTGKTTDFSSQCIYAVFKVVSPTEHVDSCTECKRNVPEQVNLPCQHATFCIKCSSTIKEMVCTLCFSNISSFRSCQDMYQTS